MLILKNLDVKLMMDHAKLKAVCKFTLSSSPSSVAFLPPPPRNYKVGLLQDYVQSLLDEKIVDERFSQILINFEKPDCVVQLINLYFNDVESSLSEFSCYIDSVSIDASRLSVMAHKIEERSISIGARHVRLASVRLIQACDQGHQKIVSQALSWMKHEFADTRKKLEPILQMEKRIMRLISKQK